jgi:hypothetical protein
LISESSFSINLILALRVSSSFSSSLRKYVKGLIEKATQELQHDLPDLVCLSTSFSSLKSLNFLEALKNASHARLVPLLFIVDWSERVPRLLGTSWAGKIGILHSSSSKEEVECTLNKLADLP